MTTNSKDNKHHLLTWDERLERAEKHGFTKKDRRDAESWMSCSLGEKFHINERNNNDGSISDLFGKRAYRLSMEFYNAVDASAVKSAKKIHLKIKNLQRPIHKICPYCRAKNNNYRTKCRVCEADISD